MRKLLNLFGSKSELVIKFSQEMNNFVVIKKDSGIMYAGPKERCQFYVQNHS